MELLTLILSVITIVICTWLVYQAGIGQGEKRHNKSLQNYVKHYEGMIKNLQDQIEEIKNRPENWKNKIIEAKETFKDA